MMLEEAHAQRPEVDRTASVSGSFRRKA